MSPIDHFKRHFEHKRLLLWGHRPLVCFLQLRKFIVKRYEDETNLGRTLFFREHMPFSKNIPDLFSFSLYCTHLLAFLWGWRFIKFIKEKRPTVTYFNDIDSPEFVTHHFSAQEIKRVKMFAMIYLMLFLHVIAYYVSSFYYIS